jgi:hypothetical protein
MIALGKDLSSKQLLDYNLALSIWRKSSDPRHLGSSNRPGSIGCSNLVVGTLPMRTGIETGGKYNQCQAVVSCSYTQQESNWKRLKDRDKDSDTWVSQGQG